MKAWFLSRLLREKMILLLFFGLAAFLWASGVTTRWGELGREIRITSAELENQALWLSRREQIEAAAREAVNDLDPSRTFNRGQLPAEIEAITRQIGIFPNARFDSEPSISTAQFTVHTVRLSLTRVPYGQLKAFNDALATRAPYIGIEQITMRSDRSDPTGETMNATMLISSMEITRN